MAGLGQQNLAYKINGESIVRVKGIAGGPLSPMQDLGVCVDSIQLHFNPSHIEVHADDYGGQIPAEMLWMLADCTIDMTLVWFDMDILEYCMQTGMANPANALAGTMTGAGYPLGYGKEFGETKNSYVSLHIHSATGEKPWRFRHAFLSGPPVTIPLGTEHSKVKCQWRAIPYQKPYAGTGEVLSEGAALYDHVLEVT